MPWGDNEMCEPEIGDTFHAAVSISSRDRTAQNENRDAETFEKDAIGRAGRRRQSVQQLPDEENSVSPSPGTNDGEGSTERRRKFYRGKIEPEASITQHELNSFGSIDEVIEFQDLDDQYGGTMANSSFEECDRISVSYPASVVPISTESGENQDLKECVDGGVEEILRECVNECVEKVLRSCVDTTDILDSSCSAVCSGNDAAPDQFDDHSPEEGRCKTDPDTIRTFAEDPSPNNNSSRNLHHSSSWIRIRNTLKAAGEMQVTKKHKHPLDREDSFLKKFSTRNHQDFKNVPLSFDTEDQKLVDPSTKREQRFVVQHDGTLMFYWLGVVTLAVLYNLWTCIARQAFHEIQLGCPVCWYTFDVLFDLIYICDIIIQFRTGYLDQGLMVYNSKKLRQNYTNSRVIYIDFICLIPLDFLQFAIGVHPMIRFPRFLKVYRTLRFLYMLESRTAYPNLFRVANLTHIVLLGAHWFAAFYYMISEAEGFRGRWSYPKPEGEYAYVTRKYLQCLFWATMTLTTIGDTSGPDSMNQKETSNVAKETSNVAYVFIIVSYLIGVFVFATIVGQVGNVINNRNASRLEFERLLDGAKVYMQTHNVPHNLQKRVQRWYDYVWSRGRLNGCDINSLGLLPDKLKTELAIHVNLETLKKVTIFQECQPEFLHDLVLKMKAYIFTPGDLICRRGEVAREMFIIADGVVEIISETGIMLKRMAAGDFFGEIGILNLDGGINRRTADVRSVGYLELFVLSREDVLEALKDHPEAEHVIREYGQKRLREVEAHRLRVKHLNSPDNHEQPSQQPSNPQTVPNRFLQTLKILNPALRRQSGQVYKSQMSPLAANPAEHQRCVTPRGSPSNKVMPNLAKASANTQSSDLAIVSAGKMEFSAGNSTGRLNQSSKENPARLSFLRGAYTKFRKAFNFKNSQRYSLDSLDPPKKTSIENHRLFKSVDENSIPVGKSTRSTIFRKDFNVTLNIEECSENKKVINEPDDVDNNGKNKMTNDDRENKMEQCCEVESRSLLLPQFQKIAIDADGQGAAGRSTWTNKKNSHQISYIPIPTEDVDEKRLCDIRQPTQGGTTTKIQPQIILDVGKINKIFSGERMWTNSKSSSSSGKISTVSDTRFVIPSPCISSLTCQNASRGENSVRTGNSCVTPKSSSLSRRYPFVEVQSKTLNATSDSEFQRGSCKYGADINGKSLGGRPGSQMLTAASGKSCDSRTDDVTAAESTSTTTTTAVSQIGLPKCNSSPPRNITFDAPKKSEQPSESTSLCDDDPGVHRLRSFTLGSSVADSLDPQYETAEQKQQVTECLRLEPFHGNHSLDCGADSCGIPSTSKVRALDISCGVQLMSEVTTSDNSFNIPSMSKVKTSSCSCDVPLVSKITASSNSIGVSFVSKDTTSANGCNISSTSIVTSNNSWDTPPASTPTMPNQDGAQQETSTSFSSISSHRLDTPGSSRTNSDDHFVLDEPSPVLSPCGFSRFKQDSNTSMKRQESGSSRRSQAMSIIHQLTSDVSCHQLSAEMNVLHEMIDKRLTVLEEAFNSTSTQLDKLAASQDVLMKLLTQTMEGRARLSSDVDPLEGRITVSHL